MDKMEEGGKNDRNTRDPRKNFMHRWRAKGQDKSMPLGVGHDEVDMPSPSDSSWDASSVQSPDWMKSPSSRTSRSPQTTDDSSPLSRSDVSPGDRQGQAGKFIDGNPDVEYDSSSVEQSRKQLEKTLGASESSMEVVSGGSTPMQHAQAEVNMEDRKMHMLLTPQYSGGSAGSSAAQSPLTSVSAPPFPLVDFMGLHMVNVTNAMSRVMISDNLGHHEMVTLPRSLPSILSSQSSRNGSVSTWEPPLKLPSFPHASMTIDKVLNPANMVTSGRQRPGEVFLPGAPQRSTGEPSGKQGSSKSDANSRMTSEAEANRAPETSFPQNLKPNIHLTQRSVEIYNFEDTTPVKSEPFEGYRASHRSKYTIQDGAVRKQVATPSTRSPEPMASSSSVLASQRYHPYLVDTPPQTSPGGSGGGGSGSRVTAESTGQRMDSRPGTVSASDLDQQPSSSAEAMQGGDGMVQGVGSSGVDVMQGAWDVKDEGEDMMRQVDSTRAETRMCQVCGDLSAGFHCGAHVCEACKKFFVRCIRQETGIKFVCHRKQRCVVTKETRTQCQYCRFQKCINLGMYKPGGTNISTEIGHIPCKVCGAPSSGYHFGAITCEGCKGFFRRTIKERDHMKYYCAKNRNCAITVTTRNMCKFCRYQKCIDVGMNPSGSRIGRQPNSIRHATLVQLQQIKTQKGLPLNNEIPITQVKQEPGTEFGYGEAGIAMDTDNAAASTSSEQGQSKAQFSPGRRDNEARSSQAREMLGSQQAGHLTRHDSHHASFDSATVHGISDDSSDLSVDHELGEVTILHEVSPRTSSDQTSAGDISHTLSSVIAQSESHHTLLDTVHLLADHGSHVDPRGSIAVSHRHSVDGVHQSQVSVPSGIEHSRSLSLDQPPRLQQGMDFSAAFQKPDMRQESFERVMYHMPSGGMRQGDQPHMELDHHRKFNLQDDRPPVDQTQAQLEQVGIDSSSLHRLDEIRLQPLDPAVNDQNHQLALHGQQVNRPPVDPSQEHISKYLSSEMRQSSNKKTVEDSQKLEYNIAHGGYQGHGSVPYNRQQSAESMQDSVFSPAESGGSTPSMLSTHSDIGSAVHNDHQRMTLYQRSRSLPTVHESEASREQRDQHPSGTPTNILAAPMQIYPTLSSQHFTPTPAPVMAPHQVSHPPSQPSSLPPTSKPLSLPTTKPLGSHSASLGDTSTSKGGPPPSQARQDQAGNQPAEEEQVCSRRSSRSQSNPISPERVAEVMASAMEELVPIRRRGGIVLTRSMSMVSIWQAMMAQFQQSAMSILQFAKKVPGFSKFPGDKQITYVQDNMFPIVMSQLALDYDLANKRFNYFNFTDEERDVIFDNFPPFRLLLDCFHSLGRKIKENSFTEVEVAFLCGLIMVCEGEDSTAIEGLTFGLQKYIKDTYKTPNNKFGQILMMMAEFKKLNEVHQKAVTEIMTDPEHYQGIEFPQLFNEVFVKSGP